MTELSRNEHIKDASNYLRGTLAEGLAQEITGAIVEDDQQLVKFHGMYLQDDRDLRGERTRKKLEKAFAFMIRVRISGGVLTTQQWRALDWIARGCGVDEAMARARRDRARLWQRHDARNHAPDHPAPRRHQVEPQSDDAG